MYSLMVSSPASEEALAVWGYSSDKTNSDDTFVADSLRMTLLMRPELSC